MKAVPVEIESFLYKEAALMDENRYEDWMSLWTDDALYWVPCNENDYDPKRHVSIIYDDYKRIVERVTRLKSGMAWSQDPSSKLLRIISNIQILNDNEDKKGDIMVASNFILTEIRKGRQNVYSGKNVHKLRNVNGQLKMSFKKVILLNNNEIIENLTFLI